MSKQMIYYLLFLISVLVSSFSQILLKRSANVKYESKIKEYLNPYVLSAYFMFFGASFLTVLAYKSVPLSLGAMLEATGYIWVTLFGYFMLREAVSLRKVIGILLILLGIFVYNIGI